jgi:hypothetical protein
MPVWQRMGLGVLADYIPAGPVDEVLADTGRVQQRVRWLPARVVVWFILALTLFGGQGYRGVWRELAVLPRPGTGRSVGIWVRVVEYRVTVVATGPHGATSTRCELFRLITTITDPGLADAAQLADCYHQRWESETGYKALKTHQRGPRQVLRSHDPDGINQELYAYLITYQALRRLMHQAAVIADIDPGRLSFTTALRAVLRFITSAAAATTAVLGHAVHRAVAEILEDQHERRDRVSPRVVKRSQSPYPSKKHATQQISTPSTTPSTSSIQHDQQQRLSSWHWV